MLFKHYMNENVIIFINHKHLHDLMDKRCYGCKSNRPSQRGNKCLTITTEECFDIYFVYLLQEIDFILINHPLEKQLVEHFCKNEIWDAINKFGTSECYLDNSD